MIERRGPQTAADGQVFVFRGLGQEKGLHFLQFLWVRGCKVVRLAPVLVNVVELPRVRERGPFLDAGRYAAHPRLARTAGGGKPAVLIDAAAGHDVEELG